MREFFRKFKPFGKLLGAVGGVMVFVNSKEIFDHLYDWFTWGGTPSPWLEGKGVEAVYWISFIVVVALVVLFVWPFICMLRARRLIRTLDQITKEIPDGFLPQDGNWEPIYRSANARLKKMKGRSAEFDIFVDRWLVTADGTNKGITSVLALSPPDPRTKLPVLLYVYFNGADADLLRHVHSHTKHSPMTVRGKIARADIQKVLEFALNIDLNYCTIVTQA